MMPRCVLCGGWAPATPLWLCPGCEAALPRGGARCRTCAAPLAAPGLCGACLTSAPPFERTVVAGIYAYPLDSLVHRLKFRGELHLARVCAVLLSAAVLRGEAPRPERLVPVPLHPRRLRERGYNQALEIARHVARQLGVSLDARRCMRARATPPQVGLPPASRRANVRGAFAARATPAAHVAIVDDVVTTGETVRELARVLRRAGARRVDVWALARTDARG